MRSAGRGDWWLVITNHHKSLSPIIKTTNQVTSKTLSHTPHLDCSAREIEEDQFYPFTPFQSHFCFLFETSTSSSSLSELPWWPGQWSWVSGAGSWRGTTHWSCDWWREMKTFSVGCEVTGVAKPGIMVTTIVPQHTGHTHNNQSHGNHHQDMRDIKTWDIWESWDLTAWKQNVCRQFIL